MSAENVVSDSKRPSLVGFIIDNDVETLNAILLEDTMNITGAKGLKKLLELEYLRVEKTYRALQEAIEKKSVEDIAQAGLLSDQMVIALQKIEERATVVQERIESLSIK